MLLSVIIDSTQLAGTRRIAVVLLRRLLVQQSKSSVNILSTASLGKLRTSILTSVEHETDLFLRSRLCDIVALLCDEDMEEQEWPELLPYIYSCLQVSGWF